ncbi:hypothetical protein NKR23_g128 [Pleurostoma richardsiae]|uniref:Uncharacterized protein n=1 Tax=Pleurostoma richardsiae TaxID=41990 RepID=A0AA38SFC1_9PEZI|nr:hypothetical protein NKR23_g128 [Pleurostoma richardsiae]
MDLERLELMALDGHLNYPDNCASVERDIQNLDLISENFASQHDHPDAYDLAFEAVLFNRLNNGIGERRQLYLGALVEFFQRRAEELNEMPFKFFFMYQPGAHNRIWMPCMQTLLSIFQINPSFPSLVGTSHVSAAGSYLRHAADHHNPIVYVITLDEGLQFREGRFDQAMRERYELGMHQDPFSIHALFLSETVNDWTFSFEVLQSEVNKEQDRAFRPNLAKREYEGISRSLHDLISYQLKYQNHLLMIPSIVESLQHEHERFRGIVSVPDEAFNRVEDIFRRLKLQAESNYQHALRMEKQTKNIQEQLIDLTSLGIEDAIRTNTATVDNLIRSLEARRNEEAPRDQAAAAANGVILAPQNPPIGPFPGITQLINQSHRLTILSAAVLDSLRGVAEEGKNQTLRSNDILTAIQAQAQGMNQLARSADAQTVYLRNIATLSFWLLIPSFIAGFFSMGAVGFEKPFTIGPGWAVFLVLAFLPFFFYNVATSLLDSGTALEYWERLRRYWQQLP